MARLAQKPDVWSLVYGTPSIDPDDLLSAIERDCGEPSADFRSRLLLRDAFSALKNRWGTQRLTKQLSPAARSVFDHVMVEDLGDAGFPSLERRMAEAVDPKTILEFLRDLGSRLDKPARIDVGGSSALILRGLLKRPTEDIDVVDELPAQIRVEHALLDGLVARYGLRLTHFQSHYLPTGWANRIESLGRFGKLDVFLVHPLDIFVGKLFSKRPKDLDDLRILLSHFSKDAIIERFKRSTAGLLADTARRAEATRNWYVLFGEDLPT